MGPGTRVRILDSCVWPERRGLMATVVAPRSDGIYPQPAKWEVLLKIDDDPLTIPGAPDWWTCVLKRKSVELSSEQEGK